MNDRHRQVAKWKKYYERQRWKRIDEIIYRIKAAIGSVGVTLLKASEQFEKVARLAGRDMKEIRGEEE